MKNILIATVALGLSFLSAPVLADANVYGSVNVMVSNDDDATGKAVLKAQNNGSKIGLDFSETLVEGETGGLKGFGKIEVGVDADDSGSDTFDSRLAYVGVDAGVVGSVAAGRQANPGAGVSKTNIFNVYGGNATFKYADRSSNSVKYSNSVGPVSISAMGIIDGATGKEGLDVTDISASMDLGPVALSGAMVNDRVNVIKYNIASASIDVAGITLAGTYSYKDTATTDLTGLEYSASTSIAGNTVAVSLQDKEGTGNYYTAGVSRNLSESLSTYAEYQLTDVDTGTDTTQMALGLKFTF
jgi:predicted porin